VWLLPILLVSSGCPPRPAPPPPADLSRHEAVALVNENNARITTALQAKHVSARGHFIDDHGRKRNFSLEGGALFLKPRYLYFDLRQLGRTVMRFGSNEDEYWLWIQPELDTLWWGTYAALEDGGAVAIPLRPDLLMEALGFDELPAEDVEVPMVYRVMGEHNQLLWLERDEAGRLSLRKEYWLDRRPPYLIRKILSRDSKGRTTFYAELDDYEPISGLGALAAHRVSLHWLEPDSVMDLRIGGWKIREDVRPASAAFRRLADRPTTRCVD
jgi:hypothetical protein